MSSQSGAEFADYGEGMYIRDEFHARRRALNFFDANAWVGVTHGPWFEAVESLADMVKLLRSAYISEALVTHVGCLNYDFAEGNRLTQQGVEGQDGLTGTVTLIPEGTGEIYSVNEYVSSSICWGARAARLFPKAHSFSLADWSAGSLLRALEDRKLPLILWHSQTTWGEIHDLCSQYPNLPVIVEGTGKKMLYDNRHYYPLLSMHRNLHLELHNATNYLLVEDIVRKFGPQRLVFGSYAPYHEIAASMMIVTHAKIADEDKRLIAGGNLRKLLSEVCM